MHVFISYSTRNRDYAVKLRDDLLTRGFDVWIDNRRLRSSKDWWQSIVLALRACAAVVVVLTPESDQSEWVQREIFLAFKYKKPIFPVLLSGSLDTPNWEAFVRIQIEDVRGDKLLSPEFYETLAESAPRKLAPGADVTQPVTPVLADLDDTLVEEIANSPAVDVTTTSTDRVPHDPFLHGSGERSGVKFSGPLFFAFGLVVLMLIAGVLILPRLTNNPSATSTGMSDLSSNLSATKVTASSPNVSLTLRPASEIVATVHSALTATASSPTPPATSRPPGEIASAVHSALTATAFHPDVAFQAITRNVDWRPITQVFDGVDMALVPIGCFMMGSEDEQDDEKPVSRQCIDQPFWIDKTEVTNAQFAQYNGVAGRESRWTDPNRPRDSITWSDARDFCVSRGGRLPTELEWEYTARGPDNLVYPWGNDFIADNVVYRENSGNQTADVGSRPGGVSWVGALDLNGNVWEWVSTIYDTDPSSGIFPYPYRADDGREDLERTGVLRALRGGSWLNDETIVRAPLRSWFDPSSEYLVIGFRCARSY